MEGYDAKSIANSALAGVFVKALSKVISGEGNINSVISQNTFKGAWEVGIPVHLYRHHVQGWAQANITNAIL